MTVETCTRHGCGIVVIRCVTAKNGKPFAVNRDPDPTGTIVLDKVLYGLPIARYVSGPPEPGEVRYRAHIADCRGRARRKTTTTYGHGPRRRR